jgi:hypothetical protein
MPTMPIITEAEIAEIRRKAAELPRGHHDPRGGYDLSGIRTLAELIGYLATVAREKGWDEVEVVAVFIKVATPYREPVREAEQLLRQLGYTAVCDRLRKIARHLQPKPPGRWMRN